MNYKEYEIVEKWKDVSTTDISTLLDFTNSLLIFKRKTFLFKLGLLFYMVGPILFLFSIANNFQDILFYLAIFLITYSLFWKFYIMDKYFNKEEVKELEMQLDEFEVVLKYRIKYDL